MRRQGKYGHDHPFDTLREDKIIGRKSQMAFKLAVKDGLAMLFKTNAVVELAHALGGHNGSQKMDHLAYQYLADANATWKIAELNDVMLPEALTEKSEIAIPSKK